MNSMQTPSLLILHSQPQSRRSYAFAIVLINDAATLAHLKSKG
jgi:hypothetical protein